MTSATFTRESKASFPLIAKAMEKFELSFAMEKSLKEVFITFQTYLGEHYSNNSTVN
jgi:hypothetical protein